MGELLSASAVGILASEGKRDCAGKTCADDSNFDVSAHSCHRIAMMDGHRSNFATRQDTISLPAAPSPAHHQEAAGKTSERVSAAAQAGQASREVTLRPYPYFFYRDFSGVPDPDPLTPLTAPGRVPNFPAKMHSILSRSDLSDVVAWMPHGRSWRILKPREFEIRVIPTYFEHAKFSSFIRQANGWGFRRLAQGKDRNSYYHEMFLRGLPHLCKMMKRPGVSEKQAADPDQEPDFYKIADENPVPEKAEDESVLLQCTLQGGPKARMPIYFGALSSTFATSGAGQVAVAGGSVTSTVAGSQLLHNGVESSCVEPNKQFSHPTDHRYQHSPPNHYHAELAEQCEIQMNGFSPMDGKIPPQANFHPSMPPTSACNHMSHHPYGDVNASSSVSFVQVPTPVPTNLNEYNQQTSLHVNQAAGLNTSSFAGSNGGPSPLSDMSSPSSQYAAGFAAATALSQQKLRAILGQAFASVQILPAASSLPSSFSSGTNPAPIALPQPPVQQEQVQAHRPIHHQHLPLPPPVHNQHQHPHDSDPHQRYHHHQNREHLQPTLGHSQQVGRPQPPLITFTQPSPYGHHVETPHVERGRGDR